MHAVDGRRKSREYDPPGFFDAPVFTGRRRFLRCGICLPGCGMDTIFPGAEAQVPVPDMRIPVLYGEGEFPCGVPALRCGQ